MRTPAHKAADYEDGDDVTVMASSPSLQDAFVEYMKSRRKEKATAGNSAVSATHASAYKGASKLNRLPSRDERRAQLRALFVERARSYIGVPYTRKHHDPVHCTCEGCCSSGQQLRHQPLVLDCCGLVRRVARSMQAELGFRLGPGNQAYQYDTLPIRVERPSQLQPGDLIFYSGVYNDPGLRRQPFDMTHVEVFVGGPTGEGTISSRERYKWVMEYDSFRFQSQRWRLLAHHFCSLDPWLDGLCAPQHPELWRPWRSTITAGSSSRNADQSQQGKQQERQQRQGSSEEVSMGPPVAIRAWDGSKYSIFGRNAASVPRVPADV